MTTPLAFRGTLYVIGKGRGLGEHTRFELKNEIV